jgi:hypothetical protein
MNQQDRASSLDELAKGLASGRVSRSKALRLLGGALFGGVLASIPGLASAKPKPSKCNKDKHCPSGQSCVNGQCTFRTCTEFGTVCGQSFDPALQCVCRPEDNFDSGPFFCGEPVVLACSRPCTTTSECPPNTRCEAPLVGEQGVCVAECGTDPDLACR